MQTFLKPIGFFGDLKNTTATMDATCKAFVTGAQAIKEVAGVASPVIENIAGQAKVFSGLAGAGNIFERMRDWSDYFGGKAWTGAKVGQNVCLTVSHGIEFGSFLQKIGCFNFIGYNPLAIGLAPAVVPLEVVKNTFYIPASVCGIWNSFQSICKQNSKVATLDAKKIKWEGRKALAADDKAKLVVNRLNEHATLAGKNAPDLTPVEAERFAKLTKNLPKWTAYDNEMKANANVSASFDKVCDFKINGYDQNIKTESSNSYKVRTKEWLNIANNVGKFALGIFGLVLVALAVFVGFTACTAITASVACGWFATHMFNVAKNIYEDKNKLDAVVKPSWKAAAAA